MQISKKLSVIIPVYNWDISLLVNALAGEIIREEMGDEIEIIIVDDCSSGEYKEKNRQETKKHSFCRYYEQEQQGGRSVVRNFLIKQARYPWILMLDADMLPDREDFLVEYRQQITPDRKVLCGGYSYNKRLLLGREYDFYLYKGKKTEEFSAGERNRTPWRYFFTGNVLVSRDILETTGFDENFVHYGYEDIEWGIRIFCNYSIHHIDNTCSHLGLVEKDKAFARMRGSIPNFKRIKELHPDFFFRTRAAGMSRLLSVLPESTLRVLDKVVSSLFYRLHFNSLCLFLFQFDKAVLLALGSADEAGSKES